jgi:hypothetical protein
MGMFDSFYDSAGDEWQTKALACNLDGYDIGDAVPGPRIDYQMKVLGGPHDGPWVYSFATMRAGVFRAVEERDESLPGLDYSGGWLLPDEGD